jgi:hypothetical protein
LIDSRRSRHPSSKTGRRSSSRQAVERVVVGVERGNERRFPIDRGVPERHEPREYRNTSGAGEPSSRVKLTKWGSNRFGSGKLTLSSVPLNELHRAFVFSF